MNNIIDLFAGAGGLSEGFRRNNFDIVAHVEMEKDASLTLKTREAFYYCKNHNKMSLYYKYLRKEITRDEFYKKIPKEVLDKVINEEISSKTINNIFNKIDNFINGEPILGIIGGPPCQAYSVAGRSRKKDKMKDDPRNYLYLHYLEFLRKYQPLFFVFENVQGIFTAHNGDIFKDIQNKMDELNYDVDFKLLDSNDFGVVQHRKRVIIIGFRKGLNLQYPRFDVCPHKYTIGDLFYDLPSLQAGEINNSYKSKPNKCLKDLKIRNNTWNTLTYNMSRPLNNNDREIYKLYIKNKTLKYKDLPPKLIKHNNKDSFNDRFKVVENDKACHTVVAHISKDGHHYIHPDIKQCRSLTVREAARIQSFPDDYYFESSRTSAFKQIGNAVPVFMADQIAQKIEESLQ